VDGGDVDGRRRHGLRLAFLQTMKRLAPRIAPLALLIACAVALPAGAGIVDRDRDRMADSWERSHGLRVGVNDAGGDPDRDRVTNYAEYAHRSDPRDPLSPGRHLRSAAGQGDGREAVADFEDRINRKIEVRRSFRNFAEELTGAGLDRDIEADRLPFIGWKAVAGKRHIKWASTRTAATTT
jgi:hypothetical protein